MSRATGRDPAIAVWVVAGVCWLVTTVFVVAGNAEHGHHGAAVAQFTVPGLAAFLGVWLVMVGAMMLPTTVPLVRLYVAASGRAPGAVSARAAFFAGYLAVWTGFAALALAADTGVRALVERSAWLAARPDLVLGAALVGAGAFQLSPLKNACLTVCRNPMSFLWQHYRRGLGGGWRVGWRHGIACVGCCWALMLVMFATGVGSLLWMLGLTVVMVVEKTSRRGARLVEPVGIGLLVVGLAVAAHAAVG